MQGLRPRTERRRQDLRVIKLTHENLKASLAEAAEILSQGGLVAYPTESFYALGADATNQYAVARVFSAKRRKDAVPLPVIIHDKTLINKYTADLSPLAVKAVEMLMPGPITLVFNASGLFPDSLTAGTGKVGIRAPEHELAAGLAEAFGGPVTATSANISGEPSLVGPDAVAAAFGDRVDLLLDAGNTPGPPVSTLLDVTASPPRLLREGRTEKALIERALGPLAQ